MNRPDFAAELQAHAASLQALARALLGNEADAADAVQETWVRALRHPPRQEGPLGGWLHTILRRVASSLRRGSRRQQRQQDLGARPEALPGADAMLAQQETLRQVVAALLALPEPYRQSLWLRFFEGLKPAAIAAQTGERLATVKSRLQRGLSLLRQRLDGNAEAKEWRAALAATFGAEGAGAGAALTMGVVLMGQGLKWALAGGVVALVVASAFLFGDGSAPSTAPTRAASEAATPQSGDLAANTARGAVQRHEVAAEGGAASSMLTRLHGRVVAAESGAPLAAATVELEAWSQRGDPEADAAWHQPTAETTAADGSFAFTFMPSPALDVDLTVHAPGRIPHRRSWLPLRTGITVDAGDLPLAAGTTLQIRVVDEQEQPCPGIEVRGNTEADYVPHSTLFGIGRTDAAGMVTVAECVPPGLYRCELRGGLAGDRVVTFDVPLQATTFVHRISLPPPPPEQQVAGRVTDPSGAPVADVELDCMLPSIGYWSERTDAGGRFLFVHRPFWPGQPKLRLRLPSACTHLELVDDGGEFVWGARDLQLVVRRRAPASLTLQVVDGRTGGALESFGARCRSEGVELYGRYLRVEPASVHAGGQQHFTGLAPGSYLVSVFPPAPLFEVLEVRCALREGEAKTLRVEAWPSIELQVQVVDETSGLPAPRVDVALGRALPSTALAQVSLRTYRFDRRSNGGGTTPLVVVLDHATTDRDGLATVRGARDTPGLVLVASGECCLPAMQKDVALGAPASRVRMVVVAAARLHGRLRPLALVQRFGPSPERLAKVAQDEKVSVPQPDRFAGDYGKLILHPAGGGPGEVQSDLGGDGSFRLGSVPSGRYAVRWSFTGSAVLATVNLRAGEDQELDLDAARFLPGRATGQVFVDGVPWQGKVGFVRLGDDGGTSTAVSDGNGQVRSPWLPPGTYVASVEVEQGSLTRRIFGVVPFPVAPDAEVRFTADLHRRRIQVTLLDADGKPVAGRLLVPELLDHPEFAWTWRYGARTDAQGVAVFDPIAPGRLRIAAFGADQDPSNDNAVPRFVYGEVGAEVDAATLRLPR